MEPQEPKNARIANAIRPKPVKGVGGDGNVRLDVDSPGVLALEVRRGESKAWIGLHAGAALKLAEQLIALARRQLYEMHRAQAAPAPTIAPTAEVVA
jgi:hypothetical protein